MLQSAKEGLKIGCLIVIICSVLFKTATSEALQRHYREDASNFSKRFEFQVPTGLSATLWRRRIPLNNPITPEKVDLGRGLYFDKRLSADQTISCATCHDPAHAFTDHQSVSVGVGSKAGLRNTPTILNAMFGDQLFWDGRATSLEDQAIQPLMNPFEMAMENGDAVVERVKSISEYPLKFKAIFKDGISLQNIAKAIATFERTQLSGDSPFDRFIAGNGAAITHAQKRGWELFKGKAGCIACHSFNRASPFFTDSQFHNTGVFAKGADLQELLKLKTIIANSSPDQSIGVASSLAIATNQHEPAIAALAHAEGFSEVGRYLVTMQAKDLGAFKTPSLRDIELTTPYMHNGSEKTLIDVVQFYNRGGNPNANLDQRIHPLRLSDKEVNDIVEFMRALTSDHVLRQCQESIPQSRTR